MINVVLESDEWVARVWIWISKVWFQTKILLHSVQLYYISLLYYSDFAIAEFSEYQCVTDLLVASVEKLKRKGFYMLILYLEQKCCEIGKKCLEQMWSRAKSHVIRQ